MLYFFSALFIFVATINALTISPPAAGARFAVGNTITVTVNNAGTEAATTATLVLSGKDGSQTIANIVVGVSTPITLNYNLVGYISLVAYETAGAISGAAPAISNIFIYPAPIPAPVYPIYPYNPCYNPCYTPCYNPYPRYDCKIPRNDCRIPSPRCNIPIPRSRRCKIRAADASESSDAVEFVQSESSQPEIIYSGFAIFVANESDDFEQFEESQEQEQAQQQKQQE